MRFEVEDKLFLRAGLSSDGPQDVQRY